MCQGLYESGPLRIHGRHENYRSFQICFFGNCGFGYAYGDKHINFLFSVMTREAPQLVNGFDLWNGQDKTFALNIACFL